MVSFEFPLNKELVETLFSLEFGPRKENVDVGAVCTRVNSLPPVITSDLIDGTEKGLPPDEFSMPRRTTILFKSWMNWAGMPVNWRSLSNLTSRVRSRVT